MVCALASRNTLMINYKSNLICQALSNLHHCNGKLSNSMQIIITKKQQNSYNGSDQGKVAKAMDLQINPV